MSMKRDEADLFKRPRIQSKYIDRPYIAKKRKEEKENEMKKMNQKTQNLCLTIL